MSEPKIHFENKRGIKVTDTHLTTHYKDEALAPIQSVQIGREPLYISLATGFGLIAFCYQFGDLLFFSEQITMAGLGIAVLFGGYSIAALRIGQYMHEKTVFWGTIWEVQKVRKAVARADDMSHDRVKSELIQFNY